MKAESRGLNELALFYIMTSIAETYTVFIFLLLLILALTAFPDSSTGISDQAFNIALAVFDYITVPAVNVEDPCVYFDGRV